jgi:hypothetical protein
VLAAVPTRVRPGDTVAIAGKGFSTTPANDSVTINGVAATVQSATASRIVATVASTATSGTLQVSTPSGTSTLPGITVITGDKPVITAFSPTTASVGASVSLAVTNPDAQLANNVVHINNMIAAVTARTSSHLTITVPPGATTRALRLVTPAGTMTSSAVLVVPPDGVAAADIVGVAPITVGHSTSITVPAGKYALRYFSAADGDRFAASLDNGTFGGCDLGVALYDDRNSLSSENSCVGAWPRLSVKAGTGSPALAAGWPRAQPWSALPRAITSSPLPSTSTTGTSAHQDCVGVRS